jgi:hypothetical protein
MANIITMVNNNMKEIEMKIRKFCEKVVKRNAAAHLKINYFKLYIRLAAIDFQAFFVCSFVSLKTYSVWPIPVPLFVLLISFFSIPAERLLSCLCCNIHAIYGLK